MATKNTNSCTPAQKKLCHRLADYFELQSVLTAGKGDRLSERACKDIAKQMRGIANKGLQYLEDSILSVQERINALPKEDY